MLLAQTEAFGKAARLLQIDRESLDGFGKERRLVRFRPGHALLHVLELSLNPPAGLPLCFASPGPQSVVGPV